MSEDRTYTPQDLLELAEWHQPRHVDLGSSGRMTGVAVPFDIAEGTLMTTQSARKIAAQLLRAADLHDAIYDSGYEAGQASFMPQTDHLRRTLAEALEYIEKPEGCARFRMTEIKERIRQTLGIFEDDAQPHIGGPGS